MTDEPLSEFVSAGFRITREVDTPWFEASALFPDRIVSLSPCISKFVPDTWCIDGACDVECQRNDGAAMFSLDGNTLDALTEWVTSRLDQTILWHDVIADLDTARELATRFLRGIDGIRVLEVGLHRDETGKFCCAAEPPPQQPGFAPVGRQGVHEAILEGRSLTPGGNRLGFELIVFDQALSCSWLCNGLGEHVDENIGIKPNQHGLIETFDEARRSAEFISRDDVGAEPGLWLSWLIVDHTARVYGETG